MKYLVLAVIVLLAVGLLRDGVRIVASILGTIGYGVAHFFYPFFHRS